MCGIVGVIGTPETEPNLFDALSYLQHRGQQGTGVIFSSGSSFVPPAPHRSMGWVDDCQESWPGSAEPLLLGVGHARYGTSGSRDGNSDIQPLLQQSRFGPFCMAHNGDTPGYEGIKRGLEAKGVEFHSSSDTEVLAQLIAGSNAKDLQSALLEELSRVKSAFSLILATPSVLIGCRDPRGYRPLVLGRLGEGFVLASETVALDIIGATFVRDVRAGEMVWIERGEEPQSFQLGQAPQEQRCSFEHIYFSRPDSLLWGRPVDSVREKLGMKLADEYGLPSQEDIVVMEVPDSAKFAAEGYARRLGIDVTHALIRTHYERRPRTFTAQGQALRQNGVRRKFNPIPHRIRGKWCVLIDDSLVRGTTMRRLVRMVRRAGARGVTVLIASPLIQFPCRYGIDMKTSEELIAARMEGNVDQIRQFIEADNLYFLSYEGLKEVIGEQGACFACFDGRYGF